MYLGRARDHAADTHRFLNLSTELVLISRDAIWLNKVYGQYKGTKLETAWDLIGSLPKPIKDPQQEHHQDGQQGRRQQLPQEAGAQNVSVGRRTRSQGYEPARIDLSGNERHKRELKALRLEEPTDVSIVQDANTGQAETGTHNLEQTVQEQEQQQDQDQDEVQAPDRVAKAISAFCLIDRLNVEEGYLAPDMAFKSIGEVKDETKFKDIYEAPKSFNEAWNHEDPFQ